MGGGAACDVVEPRRHGGGHGHGRLMWRGLRRRRKLPVVRLGGGRGCGRGRGLLRRLRLRWLAARTRWLRRAVRRLAAIYVAALTGPPHASPSSSSTCPPWIVGVEPLFALPFMPNVRHLL